MKRTLLFIFSIFTLHSLMAQGIITMSHDSICTAGDPHEFETISYGYFINNTSETLKFRWVREEVDFDDYWKSAVCDDNTCYAPHVGTNIAPDGTINVPVVLGPGDTSTLDVHLYPNGVAGSGSVKVRVSLVSEPDVILGEATYSFKLGTVSTYDISYKTLKVYPNPTTDYFGLEHTAGLDKIELYNLLGRNIRTYNVGLGKKYYLGDLPAGLYLAAILSENGEVVRTVRLVKRSLTP